tara:strand:+ start:2231 stop:2491 length:261 start_codon:yes stop_codon:yes gene_type:complete
VSKGKTNIMFGFITEQPIYKTLQDLCVVQVASLFYCVYICERILTRLDGFSGDELGLGLATVYLGFLGTVVGAFIRAAMDITARYK